MATFSVTRQSSSTGTGFLGSLQAKLNAGQKSTITNIASSISLTLRDSFKTSSADAVILRTVEKMRAAINTPIIGRQLQGGTQQPFTLSNVDDNVDLKIIRMTLGEYNGKLYPTNDLVNAGIQNAGGREALNPWLVGGWTNLNVDGGLVEVNLTGNSGHIPASGDATTNALASIARFGLDESHLAGGQEQVMQSLADAAQKAREHNPELTDAINYALQDAYAKVTAMHTTDSSGELGLDSTRQTEINLRQAKQVKDQLNLGSSDWGIESLARDLAMFGLDLTAMNEAPEKLVETIRQRSIELLDKAAKENGTTQQRNQITGASARLVNGLQSSSGAFISAGFGVSSSNVSASVDGVRVNASAMIAVGNVIVDPLVLDLNGDGIDLSSAEDGVRFDMNGDGTKTRMGFIRGDDALLFIDEYGDGVVRDGKQLFGNADGHANGFEKLRAHDDNGDGVIDENDAIWDSLRVWVEKTEDGVCDRDETMSLSEAGVKSIRVDYENVREDDGKGNLIGQVGSFERADGTSGLAADAWLRELGK